MHHKKEKNIRISHWGISPTRVKLAVKVKVAPELKMLNK